MQILYLYLQKLQLQRIASNVSVLTKFSSHVPVIVSLLGMAIHVEKLLQWIDAYFKQPTNI